MWGGGCWVGRGRGALGLPGTGAALMRRDHGVEDIKPAVCWQVPFLIPPVRCLSADGAVSWLLGKLDAAESVWATTTPKSLTHFLLSIHTSTHPHFPTSVCRWLGAEGAVSWLLGKLDAAESVWATAAQVAAAAGSGSFVRGDYSLVPSGEADMDFFCSEWSNEVLEAAGVRNDDDDYFKVMCKGAGGRGAGELVGSVSSPPPTP